jgi:hypothetical protein
LINHIKSIRKLEGFGNCTIVIIIEANLGWEAQNHQAALKRKKIENVCFMREDRENTGIRTTEYLKNAMALKFIKKLEDKRVMFHKNYITVDVKSTPYSIKQELIKQMENFCRKIIMPNDLQKAPKILWTGKGGYGFDDRVMCVFMLSMFIGVFFSSDKYNDYKSYKK